MRVKGKQWDGEFSDSDTEDCERKPHEVDASGSVFGTRSLFHIFFIDAIKNIQSLVYFYMTYVNLLWSKCYKKMFVFSFPLFNLISNISEEKYSVVVQV